MLSLALAGGSVHPTQAQAFPPLPESQQADWGNKDFAQSGEILLSGTVTSFDAITQTLTVEVTAFRLPNGQRANLKAPKLKQFALQPLAVIVSALGISGTAEQFRVGSWVEAIGPDEGTGSVLNVRWLRLENPQLSALPSTPESPILSPEITPERPETERTLPRPASPQAAPSSKPALRLTPTPKPQPVSLPKPTLSHPPVTALNTYSDLSPWLSQAVALHPDLITRHVLAVTAQGRPIVAYEIRPRNIEVWQMRRFAVVCRQHGDEPETSASGAQFIYELLTRQTPRAQRLRQNVAVLIVPVANPDGAVRKRRHNGVGQDLNRDWGRSRSREVAAISQILLQWSPHLVVDVHQWVPGDSVQTPMAEASGGQFARRVAAGMCGAARRAGFGLAYRVHGSGSNLCHRHWGALGVPAILLETIHRPHSPGARSRAIATSVTALQKAVDILGG